MDNPSKFKSKQILSTNPAQKRVVLLGSCQDQQGEAIIIINAKLPDQQNYQFTKVNKIFQNDIYTRFDVHMEGQYQIQAIYPVTEKHKNKYRKKTVVAIKQTAQDYEKGKQQLLNKQLKHLDWVSNIIEGKAQADRVLFQNDSFIILPDFKFSNLKDIQSLHLLVIFKDKELNSIRNLQGQHIKILEQCQQQVNRVLIQKFNLQEGSCRMFFHYPPTFYQLHVHATNLKSQAVNALTERAHLLQNVISNLEIHSKYYSKATLLKTIQKDI